LLPTLSVAIQDKGLVGLGRVVLARRENVVMLEPFDRGLTRASRGRARTPRCGTLDRERAAGRRGPSRPGRVRSDRPSGLSPTTPSGPPTDPKIGDLSTNPGHTPCGRDFLQREDAGGSFKPAPPEDRIIFSERDIGISPKALAIWFLTLYRNFGFKGASSHSGRRTLITKAAKRCIEGGGSLHDVQQLAGHSSLATTQRYIEGSSDAKRRIVNLIS
jgi:integrase/recombinase XerD